MHDVTSFYCKQNGRTAFIQTEGNSAASGVQVRTIEVCCTPANYVGALNIIFSDNSRKKVRLKRRGASQASRLGHLSELGYA